MQKSAALFAVVLLASPLFAQSAPKDNATISDLTFTGVTHLSSIQMQPIVDEVKSHRYSQDEPQEIKERVRYAFLERGYFAVEVGTPDVSLLNQSNTQQTLAVTVSVLEGSQYKLKAITFVGATAFPVDQLRGQFPMANGDIFNVEKVRQGLDDLRQLYARRGYINFTPVPNTEADDETATISLKMDLDDGKQFHFGTLILDGVESQPGTSAKLIEAWKPYEGKIYDPKLVEQYWSHVAGLLPPGFDQEKSLGMKQDGPSARVFPVLELSKPQ